MTMQTFTKFCDRVSEWVGQKFAWVAVPITVLIVYEVIWRRVFHDPHLWAFEVTTLLYSIHFMMVGAYGLLHNSHVNIDLIYSRLSRRWQAGFDVVNYLLFFFPYFLIFLIAGTDLGVDSWMTGERTVTGRPFIIPGMKILIPISSFFLLLQGLAQFVRSLFLCVRGREL